MFFCLNVGWQMWGKFGHKKTGLKYNPAFHSNTLISFCGPQVNKKPDRLCRVLLSCRVKGFE